VLHEKVVAKFKDGILDITLPKQEPYPSDIIKVNVE
jgi:HSP20 family molecular chaperone IbpA